MATLSVEKKKYTYEDINSLPEGNYEIIDGERREMTPTQFYHGDFELSIGEFLKKNLKDKGYVAVGEIGIVITKKPFRLRAADVVYISKERSPEKPQGMLETAPDLVVEILSEDNSAKEINDKIRDYLSIKIKRVVLVDPYTETITMYYYGKKEAGYYNFDDEFELFEGVLIKMRGLI